MPKAGKVEDGRSGAEPLPSLGWPKSSPCSRRVCGENTCRLSGGRCSDDCRSKGRRICDGVYDGWRRLPGGPHSPWLDTVDHQVGDLPMPAARTADESGEKCLQKYTGEPDRHTLGMCFMDHLCLLTLHWGRTHLLCLRRWFCCQRMTVVMVPSSSRSGHPAPADECPMTWGTALGSSLWPQANPRFCPQRCGGQVSAGSESGPF